MYRLLFSSGMNDDWTRRDGGLIDQTNRRFPAGLTEIEFGLSKFMFVEWMVKM